MFAKSIQIEDWRKLARRLKSFSPSQMDDGSRLQTPVEWGVLSDWPRARRAFRVTANAGVRISNAERLCRLGLMHRRWRKFENRVLAAAYRRANARQFRYLCVD